MDKKEADFLAKLLMIFKGEAEEHLKNISDGLLTLEKQESKEVIETIFREAHSLKGAARSVNFIAVEQICQTLESVLADWKQAKLTPTRALFDSCYMTVDLISKLIQQPDKQQEALESDEINQLIHQLQSFHYGQEKTIQPVIEQTQPEQINKSNKRDETKITSPLEPPKEDIKSTESLSNEFNKEKIIRVASSKLDKLFQQVEEMLVVKLNADQRLKEFKNIKNNLSQWNKNWNKIQSDLATLQTLKSEKERENPVYRRISKFLEWQENFIKDLEEIFNKLIKNSTQYYRLVHGIIDNLLEDTKKVLMQPFYTLTETFPRMVRDISHTLGKEVQLELKGGDIELDRRILDELKDPLIHLIRNSIDHGIEKPEERLKQNKSSVGKIAIAANPIGGAHVEISISDNGKGIQIDKLKNTLLKQGLVKEGLNLSDQEWLNLAFKSGISTSPIVTELSGRGLGMGIIFEKVEKLGGQVFIETELNVGTTFKLVLPLTLATFRGIYVEVCGQNFIIPTQNVKKALKISVADIKTVEGKQTINFEKRSLSFVPLAHLLGLPKSSYSQEDLFILIIKASNTTIAIGVDQILNEQEVLVKRLGGQLTRIKNISGATVLEGGTVIPILNPFDLIKSLNSKWMPQSTQVLEQTQQQKTILIAEDSITARLLLKNILESAGYQVKTASDGAEAFSILQDESIDLLLSDIEMPYLNGFELTKKVRQTEKMAELPIVLCTSLGSKEDREHGVEVGANAYIVKSSFTHSTLLDIIQKLL